VVPIIRAGRFIGFAKDKHLIAADLHASQKFPGDRSRLQPAPPTLDHKSARFQQRGRAQSRTPHREFPVPCRRIVGQRRGSESDFPKGQEGAAAKPSIAASRHSIPTNASLPKNFEPQLHEDADQQCRSTVFHKPQDYESFLFLLSDRKRVTAKKGLVFV
jgi:hypothetical protein